MDLQNSIGRFIESSPSEYMPDAAAQLLELLEADEVETLGTAGELIPAEEMAERLETRIQRVRKRSDDVPEGLDLLEDAIAHLRAYDGMVLAPWTFEDSEGIRWFLLTSEDEDIVACYTSAPFLDTEV